MSHNPHTSASSELLSRWDHLAKREDTTTSSQWLVPNEVVTTDHYIELPSSPNALTTDASSTAENMKTNTPITQNLLATTKTTNLPNDIEYLSSVIGSSDLDNTDEVTVYTQLTTKAPSSPSFELIVPTITTNTLPTGYSTVGNVSTSIINSTLSSTNIYYSVTASNLASPYSLLDSVLPTSSSLFSSLNATTFIDSDLLTLLSSSKSSRTYQLPTSITSKTRTFESILTSYSTPSNVISSPTTSSTSLSTAIKSTKTITQYLEDVTYTQVYVVTDSKTTLTASLLATTTFYVDSLDATYSISPPAITTDINALKSRSDFSSLFKKKLSGGSIAGIAIGSILGFLFLLTFFFYYLRRTKKNNKSLNFWNRLGNHNNDKVYNSDDDDDDDDDGGEGGNDTGIQLNNMSYVFDQSNDIEEIDLFNSRKRLPTHDKSGLELNPPPIPDRDNKPNIFDCALPTKPTVVITDHAHNDVDFDMSLFDMKSALTEMNATTENNLVSLPPPQAICKTKSFNAIDKMNYTIGSNKDNVLPLTPIKLAINDRTMGVLYESPNEQCVWDEFEGAKKLGLMDDSDNNYSLDNSPIDSVFKFSDDYKNNNNNKNNKVGSSNSLDQLNFPSNITSTNLGVSNGHNNSGSNLFDLPKIPLSNRVRSSSGATRYDYLNNNVSSFKFELEKDRLSSPLQETFDLGDNEDYKIIGSKFNEFNKKVAPPVPKPRKNIG